MLKRIAPDKWKHFFVGIVIGIVLQAFTSFLLKDHLMIASVIAFILIMIISYGFELFSKFTGMGHYDFMDAVAGAIGGMLGMGGVLAVQFLF